MQDDCKCLVPGCTRYRHHRGLCVPCYKFARKLVSTGKTTWAKLERRKKVLPVAEPEVSFRMRFFLE